MCDVQGGRCVSDDGSAAVPWTSKTPATVLSGGAEAAQRSVGAAGLAGQDSKQAADLLHKRMRAGGKPQ